MAIDGRTTVCLYRMHDPLTRSNWGGRSTSLALAGLVERDGDRRIVSRVGARHILRPLSEIDEPTDGRSGFSVVHDLAAAITEPSDDQPGCDEVRAAIAAADELVVNGEADFILTERLTLVRTLSAMRAATSMGRPVHLLNTMLSRPPRQDDPDPAITQAVFESLAGCASIVYRDPASLRLHDELFPSIPATWAPDALFSWAPSAGASSPDGAAFTADTEGLDLPIQHLLGRGEPYVVLSGTSRRPLDLEGFDVTVTALADLLGRHGTGLVFAASDGPDRVLSERASQLGVAVADARIPLATAMRLLWDARAVVSGRYHTSILAALAGTPAVLMESNSHKGVSLIEVMGSGFAAGEQRYFSGGRSQAEVLADEVARLDRPAVREGLRARAAQHGTTVAAAVRAALRTPA